MFPLFLLFFLWVLHHFLRACEFWEVERWYYGEGDECAWAARFRGAVLVCDLGLPLVCALIPSTMRRGMNWRGQGNQEPNMRFSPSEKTRAHSLRHFYQLDSTGNVGMILDSGTSSTHLVEPSYIIFRYSFRAATSYLKSVALRALRSLFDTCSKEALLTSLPSIFYSRTRYSSKPNLICSVNFYDLEHSDCVSWLERTCIEIVLPPQNLI
jgi:hypothetical protein